MATENFEDAHSEIFVPPSAGVPQISLIVKKNPMSAGINVAAGNFDKALELLGKSIALANYEPLKQLFIDTYTLSKMKL